MKRTLSVGIVALGLATIGVLTGCSGQPSSSATSPSASETPKPRPLGPLDEYTMEVQSIYGGSGKSWNLQQDKIAECMAEQGFTYLPVPEPSGFDQSQIDARNAKKEQPSYYTEYGYGLIKYPPGENDPPPSEAPDPNEAITADMSGPELAAYGIALNGSGAPADGTRREKGDTVTKWQYNGCRGKAEHAVVGGPGSDQDPEYETLRKAIAQFSEQSAADAGTTKIYSDWSACMKEAGYSGIANPSESSTYVMANAAKNGRNEEQQLDFEIAVAIADYTCQDKVSFDSRLEKADHQAQAQFVAEHKAELDAWVAAARTYAGDNGLMEGS